MSAKPTAVDKEQKSSQLTLNNMQQLLNQRAEASVQKVLLDALTAAVIGPKNVWLLDKEYSKEVQTCIASIIRSYTQLGKPIPILIAISPCKLPVNKMPLDQSEILFVNTLKDLQHRVQSLYKPGIHVNLRVEDATLLVLCSEFNPETLMQSISKYNSEFQDVLNKYQASSFVSLVNETSLMSLYPYMGMCYNNTQLFQEYLTASEPVLLEAERKQQSLKDKKEFTEKDLSKETKMTEQLQNELASRGWKDGVSLANRRFHLERFKKFYPDKDEAFRKEHFARFLACIVTRKQLKGYGANKDWTAGHIDISLVPPPPDSIKANNRLYYRSIPKDICLYAHPFWKLESKIEDKTGAISFAPIGKS
jgi:hypothetical protein